MEEVDKLQFQPHKISVAKNKNIQNSIVKCIFLRNQFVYVFRVWKSNLDLGVFGFVEYRKIR